jgi:hypothetical protein
MWHDHLVSLGKSLLVNYSHELVAESQSISKWRNGQQLLKDREIELGVDCMGLVCLFGGRSQ